MNYTDIIQECIPITDSDTGLKYQITTTVVTEGELPDVFLFVYDIVQVVDPKQDAFVRVGNPYDLENVIAGRDAAIAAGATRYRTNMFVVRYTDLELAVQAKQAVAQRIDTAVNTWYTFKEQFRSLDPPPLDPRPTTDEEYLQTLTTAYKDAIAARQAAEAGVVTSTEAIKDAEAAAAAAAQIVAIYQTEVTFCQTGRVTYWASASGILTGVANLAGAFKTYFNSMIIWFNANNPTYHTGHYPGIPPAPGVWYAFYAYLVSVELALQSWAVSEPYMALFDTSITDFCSGATTGYTIAVNDKSNKDNAVSTAQTEKEKADATLATAQANEDAALAAIKAVCPTFDPSTV